HTCNYKWRAGFVSGAGKHNPHCPQDQQGDERGHVHRAGGRQETANGAHGGIGEARQPAEPSAVDVDLEVGRGPAKNEAQHAQRDDVVHDQRDHFNGNSSINLYTGGPAPNSLENNVTWLAMNAPKLRSRSAWSACESSVAF